MTLIEIRQVIQTKRHAKAVEASLPAVMLHGKPRGAVGSRRQRRRLPRMSYGGLTGEWLDWLEVARRYEHKVPYQDRDDVRHDIILELHHARERDGKPIPPLRAYRIASLMVALYWRRAKHIPTMLSLDQPATKDNEALLRDTIADDHASDLDAWIDANTFLLGCPMRLIEIATKRVNGVSLTAPDRMYLSRFRRKEQKPLF